MSPFSLLKFIFSPTAIARFFTFFDGDDGGGGTQQTTSYSTNLPEYAKPYYEELLKQVGNQTFTTDASGKVTGVKAGTNLPQQTVAGFTPLQQQAQQTAAGLTTPAQFDQASYGAQYGMGTGYNAANAGLNQAFAYQPQQITALGVGTSAFGPGAANYYMNPYQQQVTQAALDASNRQFAQQGNQTMGMAQQRGTFGGAREALMRSEAIKNQGLNQAQIAAQGGSSAFQNAQAQFNADQARALQAQQYNQQANLAAQQATQQGQQYAAGLGQQIGLAGLQAGLQGAQGLGALGTAQNQATLANLNAQTAAGAQQQQLAQQQANTAFQNAMSKYYYPQQQLQFYSDILRGNANALGSSQVQYAPAPSMTSQVAGLGLAGLGLSNVMGKTG